MRSLGLTIFQKKRISRNKKYHTIDVVKDYINTIYEKERFSKIFKVIPNTGNNIFGKLLHIFLENQV